MANIFHIERIDNKITLGTTGTTINIASHTASQALALDASKNLVSVDLGAVYQPLDAGLTSLAGLTYVSDSFIKVTAEDTYAIRTIAETKTDLSLNLVENTALSTWAGTDNITTLGTIGTGTWEGTSISTTYTDAKCTEASPDYTYISGNDGDTNITGAELEELSDGSETTLHSHAGGTDEKVKIDADAAAGYIGAASDDGVLRTGASLSYADGGDFITLNTVQDIQTSASPTFVGLDLTGTLTVDTINEHTGAAGVTIEGILIKDSDVNLQDYDAVIFGDGQDAYIYFDETRLLINSVSEVWIGVEYDKPLVAGNLFSNGNMNIGYIAMRHNWKSYLDVLEIGGTGALFCNTSVIAGMEIGISQNAYFDETDERWEYAVADEASVYIQNVGRHLFYVNDGAGAGVGGAISWSCGLIIAKDATVTCEGASVTIGKTDTTTGSLILHDSNSANTITITAPDISAGSLVFTLPATDGDNTNVLQTDGNGVLSWTAVNAFSAYTNLDSESNVLLKSHAYQAATDGFVDAFVTTSGVGQAINIYVGSTDNPAGEGTLIQRHAQDTTGNVLNVSAKVAKDEYFEITTTSTNAVTINWKSIGTLSNPIDQD